MTEQFTFGGDIVWRPTQEYSERAHLTTFMREHGIKDFDELMSRSTADVAWFTDAVLKYPWIYSFMSRIQRSSIYRRGFNSPSGV